MKWAGRWLSVAALCALLLVAGAGLLLGGLAHWLVVDAPPEPADAVVVLGGGGVSRLREGVRLYDAGYAPLLILVGHESSDWFDQIRRRCPECSLEKRRHQIINDSENTLDDARLCRDYARAHGLRSLLVVTDGRCQGRCRFSCRIFFEQQPILGCLLEVQGNHVGTVPVSACS